MNQFVLLICVLVLVLMFGVLNCHWNLVSWLACTF